ncbi:hypothetical protein HELRODRAFT_164388 [Helobdella robusta]|uniref:L-Fucosyltransferase n=1 Tax=Helobdella robusta TaxID=6412 RepID=T1EVD1_HELRO|nr:hypothetical protein HELRODRAFT_164388 [Helobdella robusta]ESN94532.1 hypothetical protein HELRODRAFT_164388 [Helobdella robusta]
MTSVIFEELIFMLKFITMLEAQVVLMGDFNIHVEKRDSSITLPLHEIFDMFQQTHVSGTALFYVAEHSNRTAVLPTDIPYGWIDKYFNDSTLPRLPNNFLYDKNRSQVLRERFTPVVFDPIFSFPHFDIEMKNTQIILISGYFESYLYTVGYESKLKREFSFKHKTLEVVDRFIMEHKSNIPSEYPTKTVGVHIRRGDFVASRRTVVDVKYINYTANYIYKLFNKNSKSFIIYFLCSEDTKWVNETIRKLTSTQTFENTKFVISEKHDAIFDMCLISKSDAVITSTGTFSWWSGWLANTTTFYYSKYPTKNTALGKFFDSKFYYNPTWIGYP